MSERTEQATEGFDVDLALERLRQWYHVPVLAALFAFMLWVRVRNWKSYLVEGEVMFSGNDPWYHLRMVSYTVRHWPWTMPFDPWTSFPTGTSVGQFGTLYDQLVATVALVVGLGSPTEHQVALTLLFAPAVLGALGVLPVYYIGKRLSSRLGGLVGALVLALTPGQYLIRGMVGWSDHHVAEAVFHAVAIMFVLVALDVARREKPIWELFEAREWDALTPTLGWSALAGVALGLYMWVWPPGFFLIGVLAVGLAVAMSSHYVRGVSPDHVAISGAATMVVTAGMMLVHLNRLSLSATDYSLIQPVFALLVAVGCVFMAWLARQWDGRDLPRLYYPGAVVAIAIVGIGAFAAVAPDTFDYFLRQFLRIFGHTATARSRTVAEAQPVPLGQIPTFLYGAYGFAAYTALGSFLLLAWAVFRQREPRAVYVVALVWTVFLFLASITQQRFEYYLALPVAALNAYFADRVFALVDIDEIGASLEEVELYQVMAVLTVVMLIAAPLVVRPNNAIGTSEQVAGAGSVTIWADSMDWMQEETPPMGTYGGANNAGHLEYYGTYGYTEDFDYRDGEYGTLAWWDYGHWITVLGHRAPVANPFQQGATHAANFLLATNASEANELMTNEDDEETRYVIVDYQLGVAGTRKFSAPTAFYSPENVSARQAGLTPSDVRVPVLNPRTGRLQMTIHTNRSFHSMRTRLYQFHGSAASASIQGRYLVTDWECTTVRGTTYALLPQNGQFVKQYNNRSAAADYLARDGRDGCGSKYSYDGASSQIGGFPGIPSDDLKALEHYRLVHASNQSQTTPSGTASYPWVKIFERVEGAEVRGTAPPNTTVTARVRMRMGNANKTFVYRQHAKTGPDGEFTMTLPYSTTGYDNWGTQRGYTNVSVRATGPYTFTTPVDVNASTGEIVQYEANASVSEAKVIGEDDSPVRVALERTVKGTVGGANGGNSTNATNTTNSSASGPESGSGGNTSQSMRAPSGGETYSPRARPT